MIWWLLYWLVTDSDSPAPTPDPLPFMRRDGSRGGETVTTFVRRLE